jgi:hypothetical protein
MKKKITLAMFACFGIAFIHSTVSNEHHAFSNSSGAPGAYSNLPGGANCTSCHIGTAQTLANAITTDIPNTGYIMGETYNITVEISSGLTNRFGFQLAVRNNSGAVVGTLVSPDNQTNIQSGGQFITHTSAGNLGTNNSKTWNFQWVAPSTCDETVNFYASILSANNNGGNNGDEVYLTSLTGIVCGDPLNNGLAENKMEDVNLYPNPFSNVLSISNISNKVEFVRIFDIAGREVYKTASVNSNLNIDLNNLETGIYFVSFETSNEILSKKKVIKN